MELSKEDKKNGWTIEMLEKYHKERDLIVAKKILEPKVVKPAAQRGYNPLKWRD